MHSTLSLHGCPISNAGNYDIKQSLSIKRRQDRTEALQLPEETDPGILFTLGQREFKSGNIDIAIMFITKADQLINQIQSEIFGQFRDFERVLLICRHWN